VDSAGAVRTVEQLGRTFEQASRAAQTAARATQTALSNIGGAAASAARAVGSLGQAAVGVSKSVAGLAKNVANTAATVTAAGVGGLVAFGVNSFRTAARVGTLNQALRALSKGSEATYQRMQDQVKSIRGMGIEAGVAQQLVADFTKSNLDLSKATSLARVAQDAAIFSNKNSSETLNDIIHGIQTQNTEVLRNAGITIDVMDAQKQYAKQLGKTQSQLTVTEKQQATLNATLKYGTRIQGAYEQSMTAAGKVMSSFTRLTNNLELAFGQKLLPTIEPIILKFYDLMKALASSAEEGGVLYEVFGLLGDVVADIGEPIGNMLDHLTAWFKNLDVATVKSFIDTLRQIAPVLAPIVGFLAMKGGANIAQAFGPLGGIAGMFNPVVGAIAGLLLAIPGLREGLLGLAQRAMPFLAEGARKVGAWFNDTLLPAAEKVAEFLGGVLKQALDWLINTGWPGLQRAAQSVSTFLLSQVIPRLSKLWEWLYPKLRLAFDWLLKTAWPALQRALRTVADFVGGRVIPRLRELSEWLGPKLARGAEIIGKVTEKLSGLGGAARNLLPGGGGFDIASLLPAGLVGTMENVAGQLEGTFDKVWSNVKEASPDFTALGDALVTDVERGIGLWGDVGNVLAQNVLPGVLDVTEALSELVGPILQTLNTVGLSILQNLVPPLQDLASQLITTFGPIVQRALGIVAAVIRRLAPYIAALGPPLAKVVEIFGKIVSTVGPPLVRLLAAIANVALTILGPALQGIFDILDVTLLPVLRELGNVLQWLWDNFFAERFAALGSDIDSIASALDGFAAGVAAWQEEMAPHWQAFVDSISWMVDEAIKFIKSLQERWDAAGQDLETFLKQLGMDLAMALLNGMKEWWAGIQPWLKANIVDPFLEAIKNLLGISSPSTVMADIGKSMLEGLAQGLKDQAGLSTLSKAASNIVSTIKGGMDKAGEAIGGAAGGITRAITEGSTGAPGEIEGYIRQAASARGIDPDIAVRVANSEGGTTEYAKRGTFKTGSSWWPFQLHYGGAGTPYAQYGDTAGMGNSFSAATGYEPGDPNAWKAATDYALDAVKASGWGAWYGASAQGITGFQGVTRDQGGVLPSGMAAINTSGRSEYVLPPGQRPGGITINLGGLTLNVSGGADGLSEQLPELAERLADYLATRLQASLNNIVA